MSLPSARQRAQLYDELGVYLDSGTPIQEALDSLSKSSNPAVSQMCKQSLANTIYGQTFADALVQSEPDLPKFEQAILRSSELTGRLPVGCRILRDAINRYLDLRRAAIWSCVYPAIITHMAIVIAPLMPAIFRGLATGEVDWAAYWRTVIISFIVLHALFWGSLGIFQLLKRNISTAAEVETFVSWIPVVGKTWQSLAVARFAQAYDGMLNAGTNVVDALEVASLASNSSVLRQKILRIIPEVKKGQAVGPLIQAHEVLGRPYDELWITGEKSGRQEEMLQRIVVQSTDKAERGFAIIKGVVPKCIYILGVLFVGYQIVRGVMAYVQTIMDVMDNKI